MKTISIIGAGIGGLTLANALKPLADRFKVEIYERDTGIDVKSQGYALGLKDTGGLLALKNLGLYEKFTKIGMPGSGLTFLTSSGEIILNLKAQKEGQRGYNHAIPRGEIRKALLQNLNGISIQFGKQSAGYELGNEKLKVKFVTGETIESDLVVACDGVNSPIRQQMIGDQPKYLGLTAIHGATTTKIQDALINNGSFMSLAPGKSFFVQKHTDSGRIIWSLCLRIPFGELDTLSSSQLKDRALTELNGWHHPVTELVTQTAVGEISARKYYDKMPLKRARDGRVFLLGDAAHPMTPFRGQGANMAMADAIDLANCLEKNPDLDQALIEYEQRMLKRSKPHVLESHRGANEFHETNPFKIWKRNTKFKFFDWMLSKVPEQTQKK